MKKFLSLVLALVMTMSLVTVSAGAKDFTDDSSITYKEAVDVMSAAKVIDGYAEGDFRPSATLTRGAAAKIICNLILGPTTASALVADAAPYSDVPTTHTFAGYIAYCQKEGIISGYADGTFRPANSLTGYAFMKMLLGALGYDAKVEQYTGANWSINVAKRALNIGLDDDLVGDFNGVKAVNREEACLYALNTLTADMVEYDAKTTVSTNGTTVVIAGSKAKEMVNNGNSDGKIFDKDGVMQFAEKYFDNLTVKTGSDDFARPANVWKLKAEEIGTYTNAADATYTAEVKASTIYKDLGLGSNIAAKDVSVYEDGESQTASAIVKGDDDTKFGANGVLTEVFYDDDADTVTITKVNTYIGSINKTVKATDKKDAYVVVTAEGPVPVQGFDNEFETDEKFEDDAYVLYTYSLSAKEIKSVELAKKVEGKVTVAENKEKDGVNGKALTIDGNRYKAAAKLGGEDIGNVSVKQDYTIYVDSYGYMIYVEEIEEIGDYALILNIKGGSDWYLGNRVELLFTDGTTKIVTTDKDYAAKESMHKNQIVTFKVNDDGEYTLKKLDSTKTGEVKAAENFSMENDKAGITLTTSPKKVVTANSASVFVVRDTDDTDDYTAYTGIKNAPSITAGTVANKADVDVYYYCKNSMVTVMFIMTKVNTEVEDDSSNALFIADGSVSNLIHDKDGDYFTFSAVVNGEIKTVKVADDVKVDHVAIFADSAAVKAGVGGLYKSYSVDKYGIITNLNTYNSIDVDDKAEGANMYTGIKKTSKEYTISVGLKDDGTYVDTFTVGDDAKIFYVNDDDEISVSSYSAIAEDSNDHVYLVVKDYVVKTLVIYEQSGNTTPVSPSVPTGITVSYDAANKITVTSTGKTIDVDDALDAIKADLTDKGYTNVTIKETAANQFSIEATKNGITRTFTFDGSKLANKVVIKVNGVEKAVNKDATVAQALDGEGVYLDAKGTKTVASATEKVVAGANYVVYSKVTSNNAEGGPKATYGVVGTSAASALLGKYTKIGLVVADIKFDTTDKTYNDNYYKLTKNGVESFVKVGDEAVAAASGTYALIDGKFVDLTSTVKMPAKDVVATTGYYKLSAVDVSTLGTGAKAAWSGDTDGYAKKDDVLTLTVTLKDFAPTEAKKVTVTGATLKDISGIEVNVAGTDAVSAVSTTEFTLKTGFTYNGSFTATLTVGTSAPSVTVAAAKLV